MRLQYITRIQGLQSVCGKYQPCPIGKIFTRDPSGKLSHETVGSRPYYAQTLPCLDLGTLGEIIRDLDNTQAVVLGFLPGTENLRGYVLLSEERLKKELDLPENGPRPTGLYQIASGNYMAGLFKDQFLSSGYILLDRDRDETMPEHLVDGTYDQWWARMENAYPALRGVARIVAPSAKSRIADATGKQLYDSVSSHTYIQLREPEEFTRVTSSLAAAALNGELGYNKPSAHQRENADGITEDHPHTLRRSIFDTNVFNSNRVSFEGAPSVVPDSGLQVLPPQLTTYPGGMVHADLMPFVARIIPISQRIDAGGNAISAGRVQVVGGVQHIEGLTLDMVVETNRYGTATVLDLWNAGHLDDGAKIRCQAAFRPDSRSWNGILRMTQQRIIHANSRVLRGLPCLHDNGTAVTYHLVGADAYFGSAKACSPEVIVDTRNAQSAAKIRPPTVCPVKTTPKAIAEVVRGATSIHTNEQATLGSSMSWFTGICYD